MTNTEQLNIALMQDYLHSLDVDILMQMIDMYQEESEIYIQNIEEAINASDQLAWISSCHKMKGAAASAGLKAVNETLVEIEKSMEDWTTKAKYLKSLTELNHESIINLRFWLQEKKL